MVASGGIKLPLLPARETTNSQHSVSPQSHHAAHGYTLSTLTPLQRLKGLLRAPNDDYYLVHPPVFTTSDEEEEAGEENPYALVCFYCSEPDDDNCRCREAMDAYGQTQCVFCSCDYRRQFVAPMGMFWSVPCESCVPAYRADYAAHLASLEMVKARLADLRSQAKELAPAFLALSSAEQAAFLAECGRCNIVVKQALYESMSA